MEDEKQGFRGEMNFVEEIRVRFRPQQRNFPGLTALSGLIILILSFAAGRGLAAQQPSKQQWKTLPFAIVRYNDDAPKSWNVYRGDRKGIYLVRVWKRYLLIDTDRKSVV